MHEKHENNAIVTDFIRWIHENGGSYPKISWPVDDPSCGSRGAIAQADIASNEPMLFIPIKLMMSPPNAYKDPVIGAILEENEDNLQDDLLLAVFIMYEVSKGKSSFWYPYIRMLPEPETAMRWTDAELRELQDIRVMTRIRSRMRSLKSVFDRRVKAFFSCYPDIFDEATFHFESFQFAWFCIQARAFGRRLPWTAMVPFADCLNHKNVQTKYDYHVENNGTFRLYPSGDNNYKKGVEVFNSYGRRPNDNLLIDYGFSMMDNMWDKIDLPMRVLRDDPLFLEKSAILHELRLPCIHTYRVCSMNFPFNALEYARLVVLDEQDFALLVQASSKVPVAEVVAHIISRSNETLALQYIQRNLFLFLNEHETTVTQDKQELETYGTGFNRKVCALTYRLTRKNIAVKVIDKIVTIQGALLLRDSTSSSRAPEARAAYVTKLLDGVAQNDIDEKMQMEHDAYVEELLNLE